ncbi:MAG: hypothetical protein AB7O78_19965 [Thermoleophilia bacterium]
MRPLSPAALELRWGGGLLLAAGAGMGVALDAAAEPRAAALGLAGAVIVLWTLWGAGAVRRAIRLAMPVRPRWTMESTTATLTRVLLAQVLPLVALAGAAAVAGERFAPWAPAAAAGALCGAGVAVLLAAARVAKAERTGGRRILREPRVGRLLGRRSLFLEPEPLAAQPGGRGAQPWPAHRPPPRAPRAAIELEPANGPARHAVGVGLRTARAPSQPPGGPSGPSS